MKLMNKYAERDRYIVKSIKEGVTQAELSRELKISRERVRQVFNKQKKIKYVFLRSKNLQNIYKKRWLRAERRANLLERKLLGLINTINKEYTEVPNLKMAKLKQVDYGEGRCKLCGMLITGELVEFASSRKLGYCYSCDGFKEERDETSLMNSGLINKL